MHREISCTSRIPISGRLGRPILEIPGRVIDTGRARGSAVSEILDASRGTIDFPAGRDYLSRAIDRRVARLLQINPFVCNVLFVRDLMLLMNGASHCPLCSRALPDLALHESNLRWRKGERANERENVRGYILKRSELT